MVVGGAEGSAANQKELEDEIYELARGERSTAPVRVRDVARAT